VGRPHPVTRFLFSGKGGARVVCMRDMFILNEIWGQDEMYILVGTSLS
jgi:hypothetical protein